MSQCDVTMVLDEPDRVFHAGDPITGTVTVDVNVDCRCDGLTVERLWRTHGKGNRREGGKAKWELYKGEWKAGDTHTFPFNIPAPNGPPTYRGHLLNVDWYVQARADLPWATDPKAEREFLLRTRPSDVGLDLGPLHVETPRVLTKPSQGGGCALWLGIIMMALLPIGLLAESPELIGFGGAFALIGLISMIFGIRKSMARAKLGDVTVALERTPVAPGSNLGAHVGFTPRQPVEINHVSLTFELQEVVVRGSGTNRKTFRHPIHKKEHVEGPIQAAAGEEVAIDTWFRVPVDAPYSFTASDNALKWTLAVKIDIPGWPDWGKTYPLTICPVSDAEKVLSDVMLQSWEPPAGPEPVTVAEPVTVTEPEPEPEPVWCRNGIDRKTSGSGHTRLNGGIVLAGPVTSPALSS